MLLTDVWREWLLVLAVVGVRGCWARGVQLREELVGVVGSGAKREGVAAAGLVGDVEGVVWRRGELATAATEGEVGDSGRRKGELRGDP